MNNHNHLLVNTRLGRWSLASPHVNPEADKPESLVLTVERLTKVPKRNRILSFELMEWVHRLAQCSRYRFCTKLFGFFYKIPSGVWGSMNIRMRTFLCTQDASIATTDGGRTRDATIRSGSMDHARRQNWQHTIIMNSMTPLVHTHKNLKHAEAYSVICLMWLREACFRSCFLTSDTSSSEWRCKTFYSLSITSHFFSPGFATTE